MMRDSAHPVVERPGLEDVAEEEDVFAAEGTSRSTLEPCSCQAPGGKEVVGGEEKESQLSVSQMEEEFAQLTFRKQVSYRCQTDPVKGRVAAGFCPSRAETQLILIT